MAGTADAGPPPERTVGRRHQGPGAGEGARGPRPGGREGAQGDRPGARPRSRAGRRSARPRRASRSISTRATCATSREQLREQGKDGPARVADQVAERAERAGSWMKDSDADRILGDVEDFARSNPWAVAAGGLALGFVASRVLKASSSRRYEERDAARRLPPAGGTTAGAPTATTAAAPATTGVAGEPRTIAGRAGPAAAPGRDAGARGATTRALPSRGGGL